MRRRFMQLVVALAALSISAASVAETNEVKIGVVYDYTGPFAAGGSQASAMGTKIAIDMVNERGGVEGYKIVPIYADAQSKAEVAINEATRLLEQEKVNLLMGVYSSAHCVPMAQKVDAAKQFLWINTCVASSVFKGKNLRYVFRMGVHSDQYGAVSCSFLNENAKAKLGRDPKDLKVAIIYEDGPYGIQGYGVKFFPPGSEMAGQNERCSPVVMQYIGGKTEVVWPARLRTADPVLPWPKSHHYSNQ